MAGYLFALSDLLTAPLSGLLTPLEGLFILSFIIFPTFLVSSSLFGDKSTLAALIFIGPLLILSVLSLPGGFYSVRDTNLFEPIPLTGVGRAEILSFATKPR